MGAAARARLQHPDVAIAETSAQVRIQAACNFLNAQVARLRHQTIAIWVMSAAAAYLSWVVMGLGNPRVALVLAVGFALLAFVRARSEIAASYDIALRRLVAAVDPELMYNPTSPLSRLQFQALDLFSESCDRLTARDEIVGRVRGVRYALQRVRASTGDRRLVFFDGVLMKIDLADAVPGHTVVIPAHEGRASGTAHGAAPARNDKDFVMLRNPAFEQLFDVYSRDYYEARRLLTPALMKLILDAQSELLCDVRLCFLRRSLWIGFSGPALPAEPRLFDEPLSPEGAAERLRQLLRFAARFSATIA